MRSESPSSASLPPTEFVRKSAFLESAPSPGPCLSGDTAFARTLTRTANADRKSLPVPVLMLLLPAGEDQSTG